MSKIKVIFLKDLPGMAYEHEVKDVAPGYFRNFLLPGGIAMLATDEALAELEEKQALVEKEREARIKRNEEKVKELEGLDLEMPVKVGEDGEVFSSVKRHEIEEVLLEKGFEGAIVSLAKPIRELGEKSLKVSLGDGVSGEVAVKVVAEK